MDFSSADIPISRETWAPKSPPRSSSTSNPAHPSGPPFQASPPPKDPYSYDIGASRSAQPQTDSYANGTGYNDARGPASELDRRSRSPAPGGPGVYVPPYRQPPPAHGGPDARGPRRPHDAPAVPPNNVLGVFGLSVRTRERDLEDEFGKFGDVERVVIVYDQRTDRSRGFGFITMRSVEHAEAAIKHLNGYNLHGRVIRVDFSATQKAHNPTPGQYMGEKKPLSHYDGAYRPPYDRRDRPDRYDDRDRYDPRGRADRYDRYDERRDDYRPRRDYDDPYGGRSRRDEERRRSPRRSPSPRRDRYQSPDRRSIGARY